MSELNTYRFTFHEGDDINVKAATQSGAQRIFTRRHGMRKLLNLKEIICIGGDSNV